MQIRLAVSETATGEADIWDVELKGNSISAQDTVNFVRERWTSHDKDAGIDSAYADLTTAAFIPHGRKFAFILKWNDFHFGEQLVTGVIYLDFVGRKN